MAEAVIEADLPDALDGQRVDRVVAIVAGVSRSIAAALVQQGRVELDGAVVERTSIRVAMGAQLRVQLPEIGDRLIGDPSIEVVVVHADDHVLVVDKPAGMVVHPGAGVSEGTLVHGLLARYPELADVGPDDRPGIVHRLDKGTSGLLMVARTPEARDSLSGQLQARTVERRYRALVWGEVEAERGVIDAPLGRSPANARRRAVVASGRPARTRYEVLRRYHPDQQGGPPGPVTLLWCQLETGRTHQIRAHMEAIGHPVVGDVTYQGSAAGSGPAAFGPDRPFLHAEILGFEHPLTGGSLRFSCPLPADLAAVVDQLDGSASD